MLVSHFPNRLILPWHRVTPISHSLQPPDASPGARAATRVATRMRTQALVPRPLPAVIPGRYHEPLLGQAACTCGGQ